MDLPTKPLVWIDCEMTGLDPDSDVILEIYCIVTDGDLNPVMRGVGQPADTPIDGNPYEIDPGWGCVVHVDKARLDQMDEWCTTTHARSGLTAAVLASTTTHEQAAAGLLAYIRRFVPEPRTALLAGSSVHADKAFLRRAPYHIVTDHLHYRILDVSSIKEAVRRWAPESKADKSERFRVRGRDMALKPQKGYAHRAQRDILDSIAEARFYKHKFFTEHA